MRYGCLASRERSLGTEDENEHWLVKTTIRTESATGRGHGLWFWGVTPPGRSSKAARGTPYRNGDLTLRASAGSDWTMRVPVLRFRE